MGQDRRLYRFQKLWNKLLKIYDDILGVKWRRQYLYNVSIKASLEGKKTSQILADRGKLRTKRHILIDMKGISLSVVTIAANTINMKVAVAPLHN